MSPLESLIATGTKLYLDSVDPDLVIENRGFGATGATSTPAIISGLMKTGRFDESITELGGGDATDEAIAWEITDQLVSDAERVFLPVFEATNGDDGYVSFELDPLLEDLDSDMPHADRVAKYIELGKHYADGHPNRMIKVPGTDAGLEAIEELAAAGVTLNITLLFTIDQYREARDAVWRGAQRRDSLDAFKSVYSIFISRIDVYTSKQHTDLSDAAQGMVGLVNAKRVWKDNEEFWADKNCPLQQEIIFASTGTKLPSDPADKYVAALAGDDIQTNPPETNAAIQDMEGKVYERTIDQMPPQDVLDEIDQKVDFTAMHQALMSEGVKKFTDPQNALLTLIKERRESLVAS